MTDGDLVEEFQIGWKADLGGYSRKLVEYCALKVLSEMCMNLEEVINDGSFSRLTFDLMLAWETPSSADEESHNVQFLFGFFCFWWKIVFKF